MRYQFNIAAASLVAIAVAAGAFAQSVRSASNVILTKGAATYLGVGVIEIESERAKALNLKEERGVEVKSVAPDSPAAKAGLKEGDVVLDYNGQAVQGTEQFQRLVRETPPGRQVKLTVWRAGASQTITATLGTRKGAFLQTDDGTFSFAMPEIPPAPPLPPIPNMPNFKFEITRPVLGIDGESLNPQLAEFFGVKEGVLVRSVVKDSAAEKAGIKAGDVIVKVDNSSVTTSREISSMLRSLRSKKTFPVTVVRNKKEMSLTITVEERGSRGTRAARRIVQC